MLRSFGVVPALAFVGCFLASALGVSSCANFRRLDRDMEMAERVPTLSGHVKKGDWKGHRVLVFLFRKNAREGMPLILEQYVALTKPGEFRFRLNHGGEYVVGALEDFNGNVRLDDGETVAVFNGYQPFLVKDGESKAHVDMILSSEIPPEVRRQEDTYEIDFKLAAGTEAALSDERFGPDTGPLGVWQPNEFVKRYGSGIYMLQPYDPNRVPVVFIHGMSGYPQEFTQLTAALEGTAYQPWVAQYPSGLRLEHIASEFVSALEVARDERKFAHACVVAHSMGGLVAHRMMQIHHEQHGKGYLPFLMTIASPLGGMPSADSGVKHAPSVVPSWRDVGAESDFVKKLFTRRATPDLRYLLYFAYGGSTTFGSDASDGTVALKSQLRQEAQELAGQMRGFEETHTSVLESKAAIRFFKEDIQGCPVSSPLEAD